MFETKPNILFNTTDVIQTFKKRFFMARISVHGYITYFSFKFHPTVLRISQTARVGFLISILLVILLVACSPSNQTEFSLPFELSSFLKNHIQELSGRIVRFQILNPRGEPMPYGILRLEWVEGGRMDFQTDQDGTLSMQFEKDMLENEVMVSANSEGAKIKVTW